MKKLNLIVLATVLAVPFATVAPAKAQEGPEPVAPPARGVERTGASGTATRQPNRPGGGAGRVDTSRPSMQLMFMPTPMFQLAFRPDVMAEVKITNDDRKELGLAMMKLGMPDVKKSGDPEGAMRRWLLNQNQVVLDGLKPEQRTRLTEIYVQYNSYLVLNEFDFAKKLSLSDPVRASIKSYFNAASKKIKDSYAPAKEGEAPKRILRPDDAELRKEVNEKIQKLLSEAQLQQFDQLKGAEFKFGAASGPRGGSRTTKGE